MPEYKARATEDLHCIIGPIKIAKSLFEMWMHLTLSRCTRCEQNQARWWYPWLLYTAHLISLSNRAVEIDLNFCTINVYNRVRLPWLDRAEIEQGSREIHWNLASVILADIPCGATPNEGRTSGSCRSPSSYAPGLQTKKQIAVSDKDVFRVSYPLMLLGHCGDQEPKIASWGCIVEFDTNLVGWQGSNSKSHAFPWLNWK